MTKQKLLILPILALVLILASCGTKDTQKKPDMSSTSKAEMGGEMTEDEAIERYRELKDQEAEIFSNNIELWEKVFMATEKFPSFKGMDLDGNEVDSDELFSENAVTVINFWFTTCGPCVGELSELDTLNNELMEKGGELIGVNAFTLDGDKTSISEAKDVLMKKGASYRNVYFNSDSEAGRFAENIYAYPTTYVVDRDGNIVDDPIVGAITDSKKAEALRALIDKALAADMG